MKNRVCTLYRVSTDKQVDHNDKNQADIPMQRKACRAFCDKMGWTIVHEEQEEGVSGHKVRAENRDKLQIIEPELFEAAQCIRTARAGSDVQERHVPMNTRGKSLLSGNVYCGHCGARLALTTNGKSYPCKEDPHRVIKRVRYICYGKTRKQTDCNGQTGYTAHILDGIIDKLVRRIFERMKAICRGLDFEAVAEQTKRPALQ